MNIWSSGIASLTQDTIEFEFAGSTVACVNSSPVVTLCLPFKDRKNRKNGQEKQKKLSPLVHDIYLMLAFELIKLIVAHYG